MDLDGVIDELHGLDPADFTARRDQLAAAARSEGDRDLAAAIKGLRRPSVAAYTVNLMARVHADEIDRLIALGGRMREAQAALSGDELRALGRQRSQLVEGLSRQARQTATEAGHPITEATQREVQATFEAALADEKAGAAVRAGRLVRALERNGMDPVELEGAVAGMGLGSRGKAGLPAGGGDPQGGGSPRSRGGSDPEAEAEARRRAAGETARRAEAVAERAEGAARQAERAEEAARQADEAEAAARQADERRAEAQTELDRARTAREAADDEVRRLEARLAAARGGLEEATGFERDARRALTAAEDEADRAASAARRARSAAETLTR